MNTLAFQVANKPIAVTVKKAGIIDFLRAAYSSELQIMATGKLNRPVLLEQPLLASI